MTQPPLKLNRRWVVSVCVLAAAVAALVFAFKPKPLPERALAVKSGSGKLIDFSLPQFSPSEAVSDDELRGPLRESGIADGKGIAKDIPPPTATTIAISVDEDRPNGPYHAKVDFKGKSLTLNIGEIDGPGPPSLRAVTDGKLLVVFVACCGSGAALVFDATGKCVAGTNVGGHAHTRGCIAPNRGLLVATRFEANIEAKDAKFPASEVTVHDYRNNKEVGVLVMPNSQFTHFAMSRDEKHLFVGFGDGTVRRFNLDSAKPRPKKSGWFGTSK